MWSRLKFCIVCGRKLVGGLVEDLKKKCTSGLGFTRNGRLFHLKNKLFFEVKNRKTFILSLHVYGGSGTRNKFLTQKVVVKKKNVGVGGRSKKKS